MKTRDELEASIMKKSAELKRRQRRIRVRTASLSCTAFAVCVCIALSTHLPSSPKSDNYESGVNKAPENEINDGFGVNDTHGINFDNSSEDKTLLPTTAPNVQTGSSTEINSPTASFEPPSYNPTSPSHPSPSDGCTLTDSTTYTNDNPITSVTETSTDIPDTDISHTTEDTTSHECFDMKKE